jgi:serine/threonine-protein kinase RsbW/stage II sporulation protein AB (anti-sigma F factor)
VARERPTASDDQTSLRATTAAVAPALRVDVLTRAEAHALSRCAPLPRVARPIAAEGQAGHWQAPADRREIGVLRRNVASFAARAGLPDDDLAELQIAVSEALSNVVLHAYRDRECNGDVRIDAAVQGRELLVRVRDFGSGIAAPADSSGAGLGLPIIARLCARHSVRCCDGGGTEVAMSFDLPRDPATGRRAAAG